MSYSQSGHRVGHHPAKTLPSPATIGLLTLVVSPAWRADLQRRCCRQTLWVIGGAASSVCFHLSHRPDLYTSTITPRIVATSLNPCTRFPFFPTGYCQCLARLRKAMTSPPPPRFHSASRAARLTGVAVDHTRGLSVTQDAEAQYSHTFGLPPVRYGAPALPDLHIILLLPSPPSTLPSLFFSLSTFQCGCFYFIFPSIPRLVLPANDFQALDALIPI